MLMSKPQPQFDLLSSVKKIADDYQKLREIESYDEYLKKKQEMEQIALAAKIDEIQALSMTRSRSGEEVTRWQHLAQQAEEGLKPELSSYNNGQSAIATLVSIAWIGTLAMHYSLRGATHVIAKHYFMREKIAELRQEGDLPPLSHLVEFKDGKVKIEPLVLGKEQELENPKSRADAAVLIQAMNSTFHDTVNYWLIEEHNCTLTDEPDVFLDKDRNPLTKESFEAMKNDDVKGLQAYLNANAPGLLFKERPAPTPQENRDEEEDERLGHSPF